jgi:DNA-binding NtrC family response regulator
MPRYTTAPCPILVVDDDPGLLFSIQTTLASGGLPNPHVLSDSRTVMDSIRENRYSLVVLDLMMPHIGGMMLLTQIKQEFPDVECIVITALDEVETAIQAIKIGAYDYLVKPFNSEKLILSVEHALERFNLRKGLSLMERPHSFEALQCPEAFSHMIAESVGMALVFHKVEIVSPTDYSVVLTGESGTGKEMISRIIHSLSPRSNNPFLAVNMAAINQNLFEDEFFGHVKGAYTHAINDRPGFFDTARGGTLFLDEITELEFPLQGKLLRVLQEREFYRVGSTEARPVDVRVIAATNRDIGTEIKEGRFRADLYYRLNMYAIAIPPLRERTADILPLSRHFLKRYSEKVGKKIHALHPDLEKSLLSYDFPGNVRELENMIGAAVLMETADHLSLVNTPGLKETGDSGRRFWSDLPTLAELEHRYLSYLLKETDGNRKEIARILGINLATVYRKLKCLHPADR